MQGLASSALAWIGFCIFIILMLAIDLGVFNRRPHEIGYKNAALWSAVWVTLAGIFAALLFGPLGGELFGPARHQKALEFITGYVIELSLSVDNLFVFLLIFSYFKVPPKYQHRALFRIRFIVMSAQHPESGVNQKCAEDVDDCVDAVD